jgi:hypothetical protein
VVPAAGGSASVFQGEGDQLGIPRLAMGDCDSALFPKQKRLMSPFLDGLHELWVLLPPRENGSSSNADFCGSGLG